MVFDPRLFLDVARRLDKPGRTTPEQDLRTAYGRAYYSAYLVARERLATLGHMLPKNHHGGTHMWLLSKLRGVRDEDVQDLGDALKGLFLQRKDADYTLDKGAMFAPGTGFKAAVRAEQRIRDFNNIPGARLRAAIR